MVESHTFGIAIINEDHQYSTRPASQTSTQDERAEDTTPVPVVVDGVFCQQHVAWLKFLFSSARQSHAFTTEILTNIEQTLDLIRVNRFVQVDLTRVHHVNGGHAIAIG